MFLDKKIFTRMLKKAYKEGLAIETGETHYRLESQGWILDIRKDSIDKEILGEIIKLSGYLPEVGQRIFATKSGNQIDLCTMDGYQMEQRGEWFAPSMILMQMKNGELYRAFESENIAVFIKEEYFKAVNGKVNAEAGESERSEARMDPDACILMWENNVMKFGVVYHDAECQKEDVLMEAVQMVLCPNRKDEE